MSKNPNAKATHIQAKAAVEKKPKLSARDKIDNILKKRDKKLEDKKQFVNPKALLNDEDKKIMKDMKNKKQTRRRL